MYMYMYMFVYTYLYTCKALSIFVFIYLGQLCININFWKYLAVLTAEEKYEGLQEMENRLDEIESKKEDLEKNQDDVRKEEEKIDRDVRKETSLRGKRDYVPTEKEMYYLNLATERLPPVVTRGPETIAAFKNDAPWVLIKDFDSGNFDHTPHQDENIPAEKRTLDDSMYKCDWLLVLCTNKVAVG